MIGLRVIPGKARSMDYGSIDRRRIETGLGPATVLLWLATACASNREAVEQPSFDRPERMDFVCFDMSNEDAPKPVKLSECTVDVDGGVKENRVLHAVVTQTSRGEVAAVDLSKNKVVDSRPDIPGYTFVPVGESPKAVVVPAKNPETTYVADFGSKDVAWLPTEVFRNPKLSETAAAKFFPLGGRPVDMVASPEEDALFVAVPDLKAIMRLSICRSPVPVAKGGDAKCAGPDQKGSITGAEALVLPSYSYTQLTRYLRAVPDSARIEPTPYSYACGYQYTQPAPAQPRDFSALFACPAGSSDAGVDAGPRQDGGSRLDAGADLDAAAVMDGAARAVDAGPAADGGDAGSVASCPAVAPRPSALTVDMHAEGGPRLLAADSELPVIHVVELERFSRIASGQEALSPPLVVGVPTRDVAATPPVPASIPRSFAQGAPETDAATGNTAVRYIYAIDAKDGSVLAVDAATGAVLSVNSEDLQRADRVALGKIVATSLEVLTPYYDFSKPFVSQCTCAKMETYRDAPIAPDPSYLQGVFLAVSAADGSVRIVDVHDMRAVDMRDCRHSECLDSKGKAILTDAGAPMLDMEPYSAPGCSAKDTCPKKEEDLLARNSEDCRTCCDSDGGVVEFKKPKQCRKCLDDSRGVIDFDALSCRKCLDEKGNEVAVAIRRHYARLAEVRASAAAESEPLFIIDERSYDIDESGKIDRPEEHALASVDCRNLPGMEQSFPALSEQTGGANSDGGADGGSGSAAFVCVSADPWISTSGSWTAAYEGMIPGTVGFRGRFVPPDSPENLSGKLEIRADVPFCSRGVLGQDDQAPRAGDLLVITSEPQPDEVIENAVKNGVLKTPRGFKASDCDKLTKELSDGAPPRVAFPIIQAYQEGLVIGSELVKERRPAGLPSPKFEFVRFCMADMLMRYEVRTQKAYTVVNGSSLFLHGAYSDPNELGRCKDAKTPLLTGRAYEGEIFQNPIIAFQLAKQDAHPRGFAFYVKVSKVPKLMLDIGSYTSRVTIYGTLPVELRYSPVNRTLYAIDIAVQGLVPIPLSPFPWQSYDGVNIN